MTPAERRKRFLASIREQIRRRGEQRDEGVWAVLTTLAEMQERIHTTLEDQPTDFQAYRLPELLREVDGHIERWRLRAIGQTDRAMEMAWELGPAMVNSPLAAAEIRIGVTILPTSLLEESQAYVADKIKGISQLARQRIEQHVRLGVLGGQTPHEVMVGVGRTLDGPGPIKFVKFRAETITRTEMGRLHSVAADRRLLAATRLVSGLGKQWIWSGKSRALHRAIHLQIRDAGKKFKLPDGVEMMHPRDPEGGAENVANCGCESVPYKADW